MATAIYISGLGQSANKESVEKYAARYIKELEYSTTGTTYYTKVDKAYYNEDQSSLAVRIYAHSKKDNSSTSDPHLYLMKHKISKLVQTGKTAKKTIKHLISKSIVTVKKYYSIFIENTNYKHKQVSNIKEALGIMLLFLFIIGNSMLTAHYLSRFSFEQTNDMFSYLGFVILSILAITIINAKWIKIVAEKYAGKF